MGKSQKKNTQAEKMVDVPIYRKMVLVSIFVEMTSVLVEGLRQTLRPRDASFRLKDLNTKKEKELSF